MAVGKGVLSGTTQAVQGGDNRRPSPSAPIHTEKHRTMQHSSHTRTYTEHEIDLVFHSIPCTEFEVPLDEETMWV